MVDVAEAMGAQQSAVGRLLRTLASLGVFTESEPGVFAVTPLGRTLASDEPGSVRDMALMWMETHYDPFSRLVDTVKTGVTAADLYYGEPFFDWISQHPDQVSQFTKAMANLTNGIKAGAVSCIRLQRGRNDRRYRRGRWCTLGPDPGRRAGGERGRLRLAARDSRCGPGAERAWSRRPVACRVG